MYEAFSLERIKELAAVKDQHTTDKYVIIAFIFCVEIFVYVIMYAFVAMIGAIHSVHKK